MTEACLKEYSQISCTFLIRNKVFKIIIARVESEKPIKSRSNINSFFMKLSIDDLMVDSYAVQLCEQELTEIKGGSTLPCAGYTLIGSLITAASVIIAASSGKPKQIKTKKTITDKYKNKAGGDSIVTHTTYTFYK
jgi:hypothetical protein